MPAGKPLPHGALEHVGRDAIVVSPVARAADSLDEAALLEKTGIDARASLAGAQIFSDLVEGKIALGGEEQAEDSAGDSRQPIGFLGDGETFDEILASASAAARRRRAVGNAGFMCCNCHMIRLVLTERT